MYRILTTPYSNSIIAEHVNYIRLLHSVGGAKI